MRKSLVNAILAFSGASTVSWYKSVRFSGVKNTLGEQARLVTV